MLHILYILHILIYILDRYKRDGKETKEIPLIGTGFHSYIDYIFWCFPFSNVKQAYATLDAMEGVTEADWETKRAEIAAELTQDRAQQDLESLAEGELPGQLEGSWHQGVDPPCRWGHCDLKSA
jgi:hypothetical protein